MQSQMSTKIDEKSYQAWKKCPARKVCNVNAIAQVDPGEFPLIDFNHGFDCRLCTPACPFGAISAQPASAQM